MGMVGGGKLRTRRPRISTNVPHIQGRIQDFGKGGGGFLGNCFCAHARNVISLFMKFGGPPKGGGGG